MSKRKALIRGCVSLSSLVGIVETIHIPGIEEILVESSCSRSNGLKLFRNCLIL